MMPWALIQLTPFLHATLVLPFSLVTTSFSFPVISATKEVLVFLQINGSLIFGWVLGHEKQCLMLLLNAKQRKTINAICLGSYWFLQACTSWCPPFFTLLVQMLFPPKGIFKGVTTEYQNQGLPPLYQTTSLKLQQQQVLFSFHVYEGVKPIPFLALPNDPLVARSESWNPFP